MEIASVGFSNWIVVNERTGFPIESLNTFVKTLGSSNDPNGNLPVSACPGAEDIAYSNGRKVFENSCCASNPSSIGAPATSVGIVPLYIICTKDQYPKLYKINYFHLPTTHLSILCRVVPVWESSLTFDFYRLF